jgi:hypothetical protein
MGAYMAMWSHERRKDHIGRQWWCHKTSLPISRSFRGLPLHIHSPMQPWCLTICCRIQPNRAQVRNGFPSLFAGAVVLLAPPLRYGVIIDQGSTESRAHIIIYRDGAGRDALRWIIQRGGGGSVPKYCRNLHFEDHWYFYPGVRVSLLNVLIYINITHSPDFMLLFTSLD